MDSWISYLSSTQICIYFTHRVILLYSSRCNHILLILSSACYLLQRLISRALLSQAGKKRKIKTKTVHSTPQMAPRSGLEMSSNEAQGNYGGGGSPGMDQDGGGLVGVAGYQPDPFAGDEREASSYDTADVSTIYRSAVNSPMVTNPMMRKTVGGGGALRGTVDPSISIGIGADGADEFEEEDLRSSVQHHSR